jgi:hypothetical protein
MANSIFETIDSVIKGVIYFCLLLVAAVAAAFVLYFVAMTGWRAIGLLWREIFSFPWTP